ncbi:TIGR03560 family F420-dependent LLM class oxidoreductase [Nocardioides bizhenqiangii]|uniref:TIGR03560 family F420-dependent LLM class oxidoreductase n=1 Tax=Nocardioides bizhenqiangii TaxID=3095076 RepID=A0ABZ0ZL99_9ACTN|nr:MULTISPECIES: TIGR03560 family F420-dependent LLM class oxidoreductase [unclassified Nocardioides]MDZ5620608.1 TIGR03560 family F420-dependent LLM class oxidoreductase [Nocardioides sp. HM23]WQQ24978.1 TIGR03560 family F420-dependent LLM class oxidoreductase [Nocardioides sp. HM61]
MLISVCLDTGRPWGDLLTLAGHAEQTGFERIYVPDHFMPYDPSVAVPGNVHECWTVLSALAVSTTRIGLGTLVLGNTYRHPAVVANMAATLDQISAGRALLGLGAGWQPNEHKAYGIDLPDPGHRLDRFEEAVQVVSLLLRSEVSDFAGAHYRLSQARCQPPPVQTPLPLLVGGAGERRTIPLAVRHADAWHTWAAPPEFQRKSEILDEACRVAGRAPSEVRRLTGQVVRVLARGNPVHDDSDIVGTAQFVAHRLGDYRDAKVDEFIVRDRAATPLRDALGSMTLMAAEVVPALG